MKKAFFDGERQIEQLDRLVEALLALPAETEWVEFKQNNDTPEEIGEYISALSNAAAYCGKEKAYMLWGVRNVDHAIVGTDFDYRTAKAKGEQELTNWLRSLLSDNVNFEFEDVRMNNKRVVVLTIDRAISRTVQFKGMEYIRVGSYKKKLKDHPAMEAQLWNRLSKTNYEELLCRENLSVAEVLQLLDYSAYFALTETPAPSAAEEILGYLSREKIIRALDNGLWGITNLGALLYARQMQDFPTIERKAIRITQYEGKNRVQTLREAFFAKGYAAGFSELMRYLDGVLPMREEIVDGLRRSVSVYPSGAMRELVANALVHQELACGGTCPAIEIFSDRIEIVNAGQPLVDVLRFVDHPPQYRNSVMSALMRRSHICEERGSGWDKIVLYCEIACLPAPRIIVSSNSTTVALYARIPFDRLSIEERTWSCYMHACLKQVSSEQLTNASLRERFGMPEKGKSAISRLITATVERQLIRPLDPTTAPRYMRYVPFWA